MKTRKMIEDIRDIYATERTTLVNQSKIQLSNLEKIQHQFLGMRKEFLEEVRVLSPDNQNLPEIWRTVLKRNKRYNA